MKKHALALVSIVLNLVLLAAVVYLGGKLGDHPETAFCYGTLGTALAANGQFEEAAQMLNAAIACFEKCGETNGHDVEGYRQNLVICLEAMAAEAGIC